MSHGLDLLGGIGLGAGLMYFLDRDMGKRRRSLVRDKANRAFHLADDFIGKTGRDLAHRSQGFMAEAGGLFGTSRLLMM